MRHKTLILTKLEKLDNELTNLTINVFQKALEIHTSGVSHLDLGNFKSSHINNRLTIFLSIVNIFFCTS